MVSSIYDSKYQRFFYIISIISLIIFSSCEKDEGQKSTPQSEGTSISQAESSGSNSLSASDLRDASLNGNIELVRQAILQGVDVQVADELDRTAMMFAAYNGHAEIVQLLAKEGAGINKVNSEGRSSCMFAASGPFPETVEFLLENGADPNLKDTDSG
ncbi:ankyrin repeat domain-containing protein [Rhodohalobacter sp. 614A]|uniref:ankyrin repeat domain-containing protein n=1 Tax=Rhodohalobacter sp. 614A TaxID=2908649 RepID=UPI001F18ABE7|nr:ankyrin repeat domain-containing protein [Rhodohalobacter sp. 614A]